MLFTESLLKNLAGSTHAFFDFNQDALDGRDCLVVAAANWLATGQDMAWLADRLELTTLPIFIVGLGAQSTLDGKIPKLPPGTQRLVRLISERSVNISVRGHFSAEVLDHYGVHNVVVTGCPSLLLAGKRGFSIATPDALPDSSVCLHGTRHRFHKTDAFQNYIYAQGFTRRIDMVLQSELADTLYVLGRTNNAESVRQAAEPLVASYGTDNIDQIARYLKTHGKIFFELEPWLDYLRTKSFCVGTRIHGTVAALLSGTPGMLIAHDSRTRELAETMSIPFVLSTAIDTDRPIDFDALYDPAAMRSFETAYPAYLHRFKEFFAGNGLEVTPDIQG
ncbi:polysaccharide pyruvyl transferase family protein [Ruixingdingia sedimenti]|uniref:Polysaccharide pyruvyl transferase family protein n=1 Tax=Ruixingdingia sedimenti TaxID=3073604 RepID=A0ABU1FDU7_9RHOB|nr:polysaccharide pyruvyl transferase family protein [Xinfangfangia sp. LG-4]MDR5655065.1 polysaccharide pyruvyl transferase family protein [Xinfangfangia sp. LG-4]